MFKRKQGEKGQTDTNKGRGATGNGSPSTLRQKKALKKSETKESRKKISTEKFRSEGLFTPTEKVYITEYNQKKRKEKKMPAGLNERLI